MTMKEARTVRDLRKFIDSGYNLDPYGEHLPYVGFYGGVSPDKVSPAYLAFRESFTVIWEAFAFLLVILGVVFVYTGNFILLTAAPILAACIIPIAAIKFIKDYLQYSNLYRSRN